MDKTFTYFLVFIFAICIALATYAGSDQIKHKPIMKLQIVAMILLDAALLILTILY